jgi:hypothetical protein
MNYIFQDNVDENDEDNKREEYISFDDFCKMFQKIYDNSHNPKHIFLEGFAFLDQNK